MENMMELTTDSLLADLPLVDCQIDLWALGKEVARLFDADLGLPGVLVMEGTQLVGLVSRRRFHEQISSPYGLEIYYSRPIKAFLEVSAQKGRADYLLLSSQERIETAVSKGLSRSADSIYEPIVVSLTVADESPRYQVLDFQTVLLAQSQIVALVNDRLEEQWQQTRHYMLKLHEERQRVKQSMTLLEQQQQLIRDRNRTLEQQQVELLQKNEAIAQLNERFVRLSQILSLEGRKTFEATSMGVDGICHNTADILEIGHQFRDEVRVVQQASDMVARVSYQVRHLATKAAIVASHASSELSGFSQIAEEIGQLVTQTFEAGQQLERVAQRFEVNAETLAHAANSGTITARALSHDIAKMQRAIAQLEVLIAPLEVPSPASENGLKLG
jgi:hypothetical protein